MRAINMVGRAMLSVDHRTVFISQCSWNQ